jgi:thioredoxin-like negative regulator of GroEL
LKKVALFLGVVIVLFAGLAFMTNYQQQQKTEGNPFKKENLHPATIKQLDDPNYQNIILPDELEKKLKNGESLTVYFYSPTCTHCQKTSPIIVPMAKEMGIDMPLFNLLEFEQGWKDYHIEATPTVIHYENGKETSRIEGSQDPEVFRKWFEEHAK